MLQELIAGVGDTFETLARALGLDDWNVLHDANTAIAHPADLKAGDKVKVPGKPLEDAKKKLKAKARDAAAYFGGRWYLDPNEQVTVAVHDETGTPMKAGTPFTLLDELGKVLHEGKLTADGIDLALPRRAFKLVVDGLHLGASAPGARRFKFQKPTHVKVAMTEDDGSPLVGKPWKLEIGALTYTGTTDDKGYIEVDVEVGDGKGTLTIEHADGAAHSVALKLAKLPDVGEEEGAKARLANLGYHVADDYAAALRAFQNDSGIETSGQLDAATKDALKNAHDAPDESAPPPPSAPATQVA